MTPDVERLHALLPRYELAGPRYTSYPTAPAWREEVGPDVYRETLAAVATDDPAGLAIYAHVPFCRSLCHFCACNRVITQKTEPPARYLDVIEREIDAVRAALPGEPRAGQVHLGGGTPTHLTPVQLARLSRAITDAFALDDGAEVSIEVDPRVTSDEHLETLRAAGFGRISMGVQDFDERVQQAVHRVQPVEQVERLVDRARRDGFSGINFDLIYGLPYQTPGTFDRTLDRVIGLRPDRIALYSYAHVTWVAKQQRGFERGDLPSGAVKLRIMLSAIDRLLAAGYEFIGMDHFALPDDELAVAAREGVLHRNFMGYTTRTAGDLLAFGPSGISEMEQGFFQSVRGLEDWDTRVMNGGLATFRGHRLDEEDRRRGWVIREIMCRGAVSAAAYRHRFQHDFAEHFAEALASLAPLEADRLVELHGDGSLSVTDDGRLLVRNVAMAFDAYLPAQRGEGGRLFSKTV